VYAYRLTPQGSYELVAYSAERLDVAEPFQGELPISEITP
jgi:hypothetical protein